VNTKGCLLLCLMGASIGPAHAVGWCTLAPGWQVVTNGTKSDKVWLYGKLESRPSVLWVQINEPTSDTGESSVSLALAAQFAGRRLQIYIDDSTTCDTFPNWGREVRHLRVVD
jgi:hypothetical protein